ncbi:MAG: hypothetical protein Q4C47_09565, partial [Planctomycetia bacterium]|nr:hypothetical protein [Planctomycetia bacterium]
EEPATGRPEKRETRQNTEMSGFRSLPIQITMNDGGRVVEIPLPTMETSTTNSTENTLPWTKVLYVRDYQPRFGAIEWIVGGLVLIGGLTMIRKSYGVQIVYIVIIWCAAAMLPTLVGIYDTYVYHGEVGTPLPGHTELVRGATTAMAAAIILFMILCVVSVVWNAVKMTLTNMVTKIMTPGVAVEMTSERTTTRTETSETVPETIQNPIPEVTETKCDENGKGRSERCVNPSPKPECPRWIRWIRRISFLIVTLLILWGVFMILWTVWRLFFCTAVAQEPEPAPVVIPDDAIIVPYGPERMETMFVRPAPTPEETLFVP